MAIRALRLRAGLSMHELARRAEVDVAYVHRMERSSAARAVVPSRAIVERVASALELERSQTDDLLARAGYCPTTVLDLGGWDRALADVAGVLTDQSLDATAKAEFREVLRIIAERWRGGGGAPPT